MKIETEPGEGGISGLCCAFKGIVWAKNTVLLLKGKYISVADEPT